MVRARDSRPVLVSIQNCIKSQPDARVCVGLIGETPRPTRIPLRVGTALLVQETVLPTVCATQHVTPRQSVLGASRMSNARAAIATRALRHARRSGIAHGACINKCNVRTSEGVVLVGEISQIYAQSSSAIAAPALRSTVYPPARQLAIAANSIQHCVLRVHQSSPAPITKSTALVHYGARAGQMAAARPSCWTLASAFSP